MSDTTPSLFNYSMKTVHKEDEVEIFKTIEQICNKEDIGHRYLPFMPHELVHSRTGRALSKEVNTNHAIKAYIFDIVDENSKPDFNSIGKVSDRSSIFIYSLYGSQHRNKLIDEFKIPSDQIVIKRGLDQGKVVVNKTVHHFDEAFVKMIAHLKKDLNYVTKEWTWANMSAVFSPSNKIDILILTDIHKGKLVEIDREADKITKDGKVYPKFNLESFDKQEYLDSSFLKLEDSIFKDVEKSKEIKKFGLELITFFATLLFANDLAKGKITFEKFSAFKDIYGEFAAEYLLVLLFENSVRKSKNLNENYFSKHQIGKDNRHDVSLHIPKNIYYCSVIRVKKKKVVVNMRSVDMFDDNLDFQAEFNKDFLKLNGLSKERSTFKYIVYERESDFENSRTKIFPIQGDVFDSLYLKRVENFIA